VAHRGRPVVAAEVAVVVAVADAAAADGADLETER
jgi:hypothetical protein